jgi:succinyl-diaminopimelate desuccinylase
MSEILLALENLEFDTNRHDLFGSFRTVITPGTLIQGGTDKNVVPDYCEAMIDVRLVPSVSKSDIEERITSVINEITKKRKPLKVDIMPDVYIPCSSISPDSQIVTLIKETSKVLTGKDPRVTVSGPANESYLLNKFGIRTCIYGPNGGNFHGVDEFMELNSIFEVARIYASVAETLLTSQ